jgi:hypothetical protein
MNLRASTSRKDKSGKIVYADHAISKWFAVGLDDDGRFPPYIHLEPISLLEYVERKIGEKPLVLVNSIVTEGWCTILIEIFIICASVSCFCLLLKPLY